MKRLHYIHMLRCQKHGAHGFSLIEVLVAMTILSIIVLIVAGIFQQTGLAWTLGAQRAKEQSSVRAAVGALARDTSSIVDPANFDIFNEVGGGSESHFYILKPADDSVYGKEAERELVEIEYSFGATVTRKEAEADGGNSNTATFKLGSGSMQKSSTPSVSSKGFDSIYSDGGWEFEINPARPPTINDYEIAVGSCGPDGRWGTEDDIRMWVEGEDK